MGLQMIVADEKKKAGPSRAPNPAGMHSPLGQRFGFAPSPVAGAFGTVVGVMAFLAEGWTEFRDRKTFLRFRKRAWYWGN